MSIKKSNKKVSIVMGSQSDFKTMKLCKKILEKLVILRLPAMIGKKSNDNFIKNEHYFLKHLTKLNRFDLVVHH